MSSKENTAINQLFERLERRYALRVLWALRDGHPQTFRLLQDSVGGITPNTLNTRIKELREAGLLDHGTEGYIVTASGADGENHRLLYTAISTMRIPLEYLAELFTAGGTVTVPLVTSRPVRWRSSSLSPATTAWAR